MASPLPSWIVSSGEANIELLSRGGVAGAESLRQLVGSPRSARDAFTRLWLLCAQKDGSGSESLDNTAAASVSSLLQASAPRIRVCEVLLRAARQLEQKPESRARFSRRLAAAFGGGAQSSQPIGFEEAFTLARTTFASLMDGESPASTLVAPLAGHMAGVGRGVASVTTASSTAPPPMAAAMATREAPPGRGVTPVDASRAGMVAAPSAPRTSILEASYGAPQPTRADLDSEHARLSAAVQLAQAENDRLELEAETLRSMLAKDTMARSGQEDGPNSHSIGVHIAQLHKVIGDRSAQVDRLTGQARRLESELLFLMEDCTAVVLRAGELQDLRDQQRLELEELQGDAEDLERQLLAEQLRVVMLRSAYEEEQPALGRSLDAAEVMCQHVSRASRDVYAFEQEERAAAQAFIEAAREAEAGEEEDEAVASERLGELTAELEAAELLLQGGSHANSAEGVAGATLAELTSQCAQAIEGRAAAAEAARAHRLRAESLRRSLKACQQAMATTMAAQAAPGGSTAA